jgi:hypothetical protein
MRSRLIPPIYLVLLASFASATYTVHVSDINTMVPIVGANVSISNGSVVLEGNTDSGGLYVSDFGGEVPFNVSIGKNGYYPVFVSELNGSTVYNGFLYPMSSDGIIRFSVQNLGLSDRARYCVFFDENTRLKGCYLVNDTLTLLVDRNYTVVPELTNMDLLTGDNFSRYGYLFVPGLISGGVILAVVGIMFYFVFVWRRRK